jgi:hypothetical protein
VPNLQFSCFVALFSLCSSVLSHCLVTVSTCKCLCCSVSGLSSTCLVSSCKRLTFCTGQVLISEGMLEAAALLSLLRPDFDSDLVDGLALCLRDRPEHHKCLCDWLLGVALTLLEPDPALEPTCRRPFRGLKRFSSFSESKTAPLSRVQPDDDTSWVSAFGPPSPELAPAAPAGSSATIPPLQMNQSLPHPKSRCATQPFSQEARFRFFAERVARLQLWRSCGTSGVTLFDQLRMALQPLVDRLSAQCDARFAELDRHPAGSALRLFGSGFRCSPEEQDGEKAKAEHIQRAAEKEALDQTGRPFSVPVDGNQVLFNPGNGFYDGTGLGVQKESTSVSATAALAMMLNPAAQSASSQRSSGVIDRQDHPQVSLPAPM